MHLPTDFSCRRCGACCQGPGDVILAPGEVESIAAMLGVTAYDFTARYTRLLADRRGLSLTDRPDGACIFLEADNTCRIQPVKPRQCIGFPSVWSSARLASDCLGLKRSG
jgi:uncharacterized protein